MHRKLVYVRTHALKDSKQIAMAASWPTFTAGDVKLAQTDCWSNRPCIWNYKWLQQHGDGFSAALCKEQARSIEHDEPLLERKNRTEWLLNPQHSEGKQPLGVQRQTPNPALVPVEPEVAAGLSWTSWGAQELWCKQQGHNNASATVPFLPPSLWHPSCHSEWHPTINAACSPSMDNLQ